MTHGLKLEVTALNTELITHQSQTHYSHLSFNHRQKNSSWQWWKGMVAKGLR